MGNPNGHLCGNCVLGTRASGYVISRGTGKNGVCLVGEALGEDEVYGGVPFFGKAGKFLDRIITRTTDPESGQPLNPDDFLITNILRCRPPGNELTGTPYEYLAIEHCRPYLEQFIREHKPRTFVSLGNQPLRWFTGNWGVEKLRGYIFDSKFGPVVGTYHPAYLVRGKFNLVRVVQMDILKALYTARQGKPEFKKVYQLRPTPQEVREFSKQYREALQQDPKTRLSFDIETPHSSFLKDDSIDPDIEEINIEDDPSYQIDRISFSFKGGYAITMPWMPPYSEIARELLSTTGDLVGWNCNNFDIPRLLHNGCTFRGRVIDGMDLFHFIEPGFPMGLKYAATFYCPDLPAWKLQSASNPEWYSCVDSDAALRCVEKMQLQAEKEGRWGTFEKHFIELGVVLRKMSGRGIRIDRELRGQALREFRGRFVDTVSQIQGEIPEALKPKKIYKKSKEQLEKIGAWQEGKMIQVLRMETPEHKHEWRCKVQDVECDCGKIKARPKSFKCACHIPVVVKKERKKKNEQKSTKETANPGS